MPSEHRLHPVSIVFTIGSSARRLLLPGLVVLLAARTTDYDVYFMVLFVPYAIAAMLRFLTLRYAFASDELVVRSGLIFRNVRHIPYARIHNIGVVQNLLHRMLGVAEVRVETAAGGGQKAEARLQVLTLEATEEMRRRVGERKARARALARGSAREAGGEPEPGAPASGAFAGDAAAVAGHEGAEGALAAAGSAAPPASEEMEGTTGQGAGAPGADAGVKPIAEGRIARPWEAAPAADGELMLHLPARELLLFGLIENRGLVVVAAIWGFLWQLSWQLGWLRGRDLVVSDAVIGPIATAFKRTGLAGGLLMAAALIVVFLISLRVFSVGWALVKLYGFTLRRKDGSLSTASGLFTRVSTAIPARRIQVLTLREGPLHRLFERVELRADIVGGEAEDSSAAHERLAPLVRTRDAMPLVRRIEPALDFDQVVWSPVHPRAWRRLLKVYLFVTAAGTAVLAANLGWEALLLLPLLAPLLWLLAVRQARNLGWCVNSGGVFFRSGWLWRRASGARLDKVQTISLVESPFDRRSGMAGLRVDNAGQSHFSHKIHIPYLEASTARRLLDELEARAARSDFRL